MEVPQIVYAAHAMAERLSEPTIEVTPVPQRHQALCILRLGQARLERLLEAAHVGQIDMGGLFHARRGKKYVGAAWGQVVAGHTAFCWPACIVAGEPEHTAFRLLAAVNRHLDNTGVVLTQAILSPRDLTMAVRLTRAGYRHLTDLEYMVSESASFPQRPPHCALQFTPATRGDTAPWPQLIQRTYEGTLDCAELENFARCPMFWRAIGVPGSIGRNGGFSPRINTKKLAVCCWQIIPSMLNPN